MPIVMRVLTRRQRTLVHYGVWASAQRLFCIGNNGLNHRLSRTLTERRAPLGFPRRDGVKKQGAAFPVLGNMALIQVVKRLNNCLGPCLSPLLETANIFLLQGPLPRVKSGNPASLPVLAHIITVVRVRQIPGVVGVVLPAAVDTQTPKQLYFRPPTVGNSLIKALSGVFSENDLGLLLCFTLPGAAYQCLIIRNSGHGNHK